VNGEYGTLEQLDPAGCLVSEISGNTGQLDNGLSVVMELSEDRQSFKVTILGADQPVYGDDSGEIWTE